MWASCLLLLYMLTKTVLLSPPQPYASSDIRARAMHRMGVLSTTGANAWPHSHIHLPHGVTSQYGDQTRVDRNVELIARMLQRDPPPQRLRVSEIQGLVFMHLHVIELLNGSTDRAAGEATLVQGHEVPGEGIVRAQPTHNPSKYPLIPAAPAPLNGPPRLGNAPDPGRTGKPRKPLNARAATHEEQRGLTSIGATQAGARDAAAPPGRGFLDTTQNIFNGTLGDGAAAGVVQPGSSGPAAAAAAAASRSSRSSSSGEGNGEDVGDGIPPTLAVATVWGS
ncbi:unnamed protein product [Vitrella brassicaformis CCMP3155]|uniref:Uncharacterized protein n=1 Tax=Vitrella brassicaformis (strain CCMP3155) TaxID=1169540 RepID=A0A0G4GCW1_VITBC|nr:unnamed protein product [Vitrella brassicaformis CCMP3155]|eukprot:CEM27114.1 unnamed protein product [Vitrella brassicaformis CCMP3155]